MYSALDRRHPTFTHFPTDKQHLWFRQFAQEFNWNSDETLFIFYHFVHKVMDNYGKQIHEWKKKWEINKSVPKKKGRLVGLGRRSRSAAPSSAPPPYVDPEVLTAQLKDKDDRISVLETQMAAQQAGYETQKRLNEQMMEMMKRMYPNEVFPNIQDP
ncbi:hypothetical protein DY000_02042963 [Brassica cretica]|uniref:Uncharacterized protein n=1 Tax=Brassica cretica TaxID=69181 RepID=A0ABQ7B9P8_BRACR|nr:hypothetical protein DY000_02042963 [Brassica cretica]